jgi:hypothetical protein
MGPDHQHLVTAMMRNTPIFPESVSGETMEHRTTPAPTSLVFGSVLYADPENARR